MPQKFTDCPDFNFAAATLNNFTEEAKAKFTKGQTEHGGSIMDKPLMKEMKHEVIDQMFYVSAIQEKVNAVKRDLAHLIDMVDAEKISIGETLTSLCEMQKKLNNL